MKKRAYARVSTDRQDLDMQLDALYKYGCDVYYSEKLSGMVKVKPEFEKMIRQSDSGDVIVVYSLSRMSRSLKDMLNILEVVRDKGLNLVSLTEPIDTTTPMGVAFFQLIGVFAELERAILVQRVTEGSRLARLRGEGGGRKKALDDKQIVRLREMHARGDIKIKDLCKMFGIGTTALYNYLKQ